MGATVLHVNIQVDANSAHHVVELKAPNRPLVFYLCARTVGNEARTGLPVFARLQSSIIILAIYSILLQAKPCIQNASIAIPLRGPSRRPWPLYLIAAQEPLDPQL